MPTPPLVTDPLFFLDYDGTLAPIVDDPARAFPHPDVPALLERLAAAFPVWIITGRHLRDLGGFFNLPLKAVGLHGMQEGIVGGTLHDRVPPDAGVALDALRAAVPRHEGLRVEDKGPTFAVHYRQAPDAEAARGALRAWLADLPESLEPIWGKMVVELRPRGVSKGVAVRRLADAHSGRTPLYLGDDVTDEDAFEALGPQAVTIKVGEGDTRARYRLPSVDAVVAYLERYLAEDASGAPS